MPALRTLALCAAALLVSATAGATALSNGKPVEAMPATTELGTREQLRQCMQTEDSLKQRSKAVEAAVDVNEKLLKRSDDESRRLEELHDKLDHDSEVAVKSYNELIKEHNAHVKELNDQYAATNPAGEAYQADVAAYHRQCSGLRYSMDDMDAVMAERRKSAAVAPAKP